MTRHVFDRFMSRWSSFDTMHFGSSIINYLEDHLRRHFDFC
jgi:hypothetical protein